MEQLSITGTNEIVTDYCVVFHSDTAVTRGEKAGNEDNVVTDSDRPTARGRVWDARTDTFRASKPPLAAYANNPDATVRFGGDQVPVEHVEDLDKDGYQPPEKIEARNDEPDTPDPSPSALGSYYDLSDTVDLDDVREQIGTDEDTEVIVFGVVME